MTTPKIPGPQHFPDAIAAAADEAKHRKSFFSFGSDGITATIGNNGRLLRISRHFPKERVGFCVDSPQMPTPYCVLWRLETLLQWAETPLEGGGLGPTIHNTPSETIVNDRWPTFEERGENGAVFKQQYVVFDDLLCQRLEFANYKTKQDDNSQTDSMPELVIRPDMLLRNLDFVDSENNFNMMHSSDGSYKTRLEGRSLIRERSNGDKNITLEIHLLDERGVFEFVETSTSDISEESSYAIQHSSKEAKTSEDNPESCVTVILAYRLRYTSDTTDHDNYVFELDWRDVSKTMDAMLMSRAEHTLTGNSKLDYFLRRNLEYTLSVCSISFPDTEEDDLPYFALTCGDVDNHRVTTAASFYAFQLLLLGLKHLDCQNHTDPYDCSKHSSSSEVWSSSSKKHICEVRGRIFKVLYGHIKWLFQKANSSGGPFCPNYWASGAEIHEWEDNFWLPKRSLVDTPFQIIKACDLVTTIGKDKLPWLFSKLSAAIEVWIRNLDEINKMGLHAFPRYDKEATDSFYLTDHALIWRAIRAAEVAYPKLKFKGSASNISYSSQILQRSIIKRFTTENPQSKKRMIAVVRSPIQSRFLLRSRDTALFPTVDLGFFETPESEKHNTDPQLRSQLWTSTLDCQKNHEDNEDILKWRDPLRFALSIIMAGKNKPMNSGFENETHEHALSVLLKGSSANCLFSGWLDDNHEPVVYESERLRDRYWEVTFEIPYLLWKYCRESIWATSFDNKHAPEPKVAGRRATVSIKNT
ncbi:mg2+ transporter zinc transport protein [Colletotrichum asianum]